MTWLKTYSPGSPFAQSGRVNLDQVLWLESALAGGNFGVNAVVSTATATLAPRLMTPGYPYATAADAVAAIDDLILNGS